MTAPGQGNLGRRDSALHPHRPFWELQPSARTALPHKGGEKGGWSRKPAKAKAQWKGVPSPRISPRRTKCWSQRPSCVFRPQIDEAVAPCQRGGRPLPRPGPRR